MWKLSCAMPDTDGWHRARARWDRWRGLRPFAGGILTTVGGLVIMVIPAGLGVLPALPGLAGLAGLLLGGFLALLGPVIWLRPSWHTPLGLIVTLAALASFVFATLGGLLTGTLLSLVGGSLAFAWSGPSSGDESETG